MVCSERIKIYKLINIILNSKNGENPQNLILIKKELQMLKDNLNNKNSLDGSILKIIAYSNTLIFAYI